MEEIKVGEYIKTVAGYIGKIINFNDGMYTAKMKDVTIYLYIDGIKNHSFNIIDLVEENDAIKFWYEKERICNVYKTSNGNLCVWNGFEDVPIKHIHIKSIVTKEQFENAEYRLYRLEE